MEFSPKYSGLSVRGIFAEIPGQLYSLGILIGVTKRRKGFQASCLLCTSMKFETGIMGSVYTLFFLRNIAWHC